MQTEILSKPYCLLVRLDSRFNRNLVANTIARQKRQYIGLLKFFVNSKETKLPGTCVRLRHACTVITRVECLNETQPIIMSTFIDQWLLNISICGFTCIFYLFALWGASDLLSLLFIER